MMTDHVSYLRDSIPEKGQGEKESAKKLDLGGNSDICNFFFGIRILEYQHKQMINLINQTIN